MADESSFPPLPSSREEIEQLRAWNLEMLEAWYRKKDRYVREYNIICMWGNEVARNPNISGTPLQKQVWELTYAPVAGDPDRRLCQPESWFMLVEEVKRHLPRNRLRHCYQQLLLIRQNGLNHNFSCGSNKLARDAQAVVLELFAIAEELEDRLVASLNRISGDTTDVDSTVRKERLGRALKAANDRADREAKNKEFELKIEPQHAAKAIARVLNMVGETWTTIAPDQLTKLDEKAVYWLGAAGMLERQMTLRLRHIGEPTYFEATITVTGEGGFSEAMQPVHARSYEKWFDAWEKWMESPNAGVSPYTTEKLNPGETLRLTDQGMIARDDMRAGNTKVVIEFALKQGLFATRPLVRGAGVCLEFKELHNGAAPSIAPSVQTDANIGESMQPHGDGEDEGDPDAFVEQRQRDVRRRLEGRHLRYAGHRDFHDLWCWGCKIDWMLEDRAYRDDLDGWNFLPTPEAASALDRLSIKYPQIISDLREWLKKVEEQFSNWQQHRTKPIEGVLNETLGILSDRILAKTDIIAESEGVTPNPAKAPESKIRMRPRDELDEIISDRDVESESSKSGVAAATPTNIPRGYVFVRYWPGFTDKFPYEQFNGLSDGELEKSVRSALAAELWKRRDAIRSKRRAAKQHRALAIEKRRTQFLPRPNTARRPLKTPPTKIRKSRAFRFSCLAGAVGWHEPAGGYVTTKNADYIFSPRIWMAAVGALDHGAYLAQHLADLRPVDDAGWDQHRSLNPKYGYVSVDDLSVGAQAGALSAIERIHSNRQLDIWENYVRRTIPTVNQFLSHLHSLDRPNAGGSDAGVADAEPTLVDVPADRQPAARNDDQILVVHITPQAAYIEFERVKHPVKHNVADAFQKMLDAKGRPVGIGPILGEKPARALSKVAPELRSIVRQDGNKGYRLTIFD